MVVVLSPGAKSTPTYKAYSRTAEPDVVKCAGVGVDVLITTPEIGLEPMESWAA